MYLILSYFQQRHRRRVTAAGRALGDGGSPAQPARRPPRAPGRIGSPTYSPSASLPREPRTARIATLAPSPALRCPAPAAILLAALRIHLRYLIESGNQLDCGSRRGPVRVSDGEKVGTGWSDIFFFPLSARGAAMQRQPRLQQPLRCCAGAARGAASAWY